MLTITITTLAGWLTDWLKIAHTRTMFECFSQSDCKVWQDNDALTVSERGREFINIVCWHNFAQEMNDGLKQWTFIQLPTFQIAFRKAAFRLLHSLKMNWCHMKWYTHKHTKQQRNGETSKTVKHWQTEALRFTIFRVCCGSDSRSSELIWSSFSVQCNILQCVCCVCTGKSFVSSFYNQSCQSVTRSLAHTQIRPVNVCVCVVCAILQHQNQNYAFTEYGEAHTHTVR